MVPCDDVPGATVEPFEQVFLRCRERLRLAVSLRMDARVRGRVDPSDVLQETYIEAARRYEELQQQPDMTAYVWLRFLAVQQLLIAHRRHLGTKARDAGREVALDGSPDVSTDALAALLLDSGTSPSVAAARAETQARLNTALTDMEAADREILVLRHFEQMTNAEAAGVMGLNTGAASQRYYRALKKLHEVLGDPSQ